MKKIFTLLIIGSIILLSGCLAKAVDYPIRDVPTESEYQELVASLKESTVAIYGYYMTFDLSLGSGLIYDREPSRNEGYYYYYVLTNNHVVETMTYVQIRTQTGPIEIGDIYAFPTLENDDDDIAIVRFESEFDYPMIEILPLNEEVNTHVQLAIGQYVFGIGTPISKDNFNLSTNLGIISDINSEYISHTANINPGNSGGPLFSYDGTFIGVNTQRVEIINEETIYLIGDAIHVNKVAEVMTRRLNDMKPKLGVIVRPYDEFVTIDYEAYFGEKAEDFDPYDHVPQNASGVVLIEVNVTRSSHDILKRYDLVQAINGQTVLENADFITALGDINIGSIYVFEVLRYNETTKTFERLELEVTIS